MALPIGYVQLEYIQSSGSQYIDTGFVPNQNTRVVMDFDLPSVTNQYGHALFSARASKTTKMFYFFSSGTSDSAQQWTSGFGAVSTKLKATVTGRHTVDMSKNGTIIDGSTITNTYSEFSPGNNLVLLADNYDDGINSALYGKAKIYSCKIYDNGVLVRDFIPCKNTLAVIGLWDNANSNFYVNAGTGTFAAGPVFDPTAPRGKHNILVDGVSCEITGGKVLVGGAGYDIKKGRTLINGIGCDIPLSVQKVTIAFEYGYNADLTFATVDGGTYGGRSGSPGTETVEVEAGTEVTFTIKSFKDVYGSGSGVSTSSKITVDGTNVASGSNQISYLMVVNGDITVSMDRTTSQGVVFPVIAITTK